MIACLATKIAGIGYGLDCVQYWPTIDEPMKFGQIKVTSKSRDKVNGLSKLVTNELLVELFDEQDEFKTEKPIKEASITHLWFSGWPEFGVPS